MADSEASGKARLDDPVDDPVDTDELAVDPPEDVEWFDPAPPTEAVERTFDAFNESTWNFKPAPTPWYRTGPSLTVIVAVSVAVIALVVSVVLLTVRESAGERTLPANEPDTSIAPTTATAPPTTAAESPLPPPPPPPPPPPTASEINRAPIVERQPRPTKKPEINVTRTPMSVHPQMPSTRRP